MDYSRSNRDADLASPNAHGETLSSQSGWKPLLCALGHAFPNARGKTQAGAPQAARLHLLCGATPAAVTAEGRTALLASEATREARDDLYDDEPRGFRVGKTLVRCAATEPSVAKDGLTPLLCIAGRGSLGVVRALLDAGAGPKLRDSTDLTPWRLVCEPEYRTGTNPSFADSSRGNPEGVKEIRMEWNKLENRW
ncbi:uncharacterized protein PG998_013265 [Apiospora kogelbergensis]|uniref:uncharacterized protein n=1 Tax=Apiospora kogelbergensis TaxID=1337665 RepID=UPI00313079E5